MVLKLYDYPENTTIQIKKKTKALLRTHRLGKEPIDKTIRRLILSSRQ